MKAGASMRRSRTGGFHDRVERKQIPLIELLERRELLSLAHSTVPAPHVAHRSQASRLAVAIAPARASAEARENASVTLSAASPGAATFIDPTAVIRGARAISIGIQDYVAPFATLMASRGGTISIGNGSNVQDNVEVLANGPRARVEIGDQAILAHNATVIGPATIGAKGGAPTFVGFNAIIRSAPTPTRRSWLASRPLRRLSATESSALSS